MEHLVRIQKPTGDSAWGEDYQRMAQAICYIQAHREDQPSLEAVAKAQGLSPFHFQRLFSQWTGLSPKQFLGFLTLDSARKPLLDGKPVLETALEVGLSGPSRLHDLAVTLEAATPGDIASGGRGLQVTTGLAETPFGLASLSETPKGLTNIAFLDDPKGEVSADSPFGVIRRIWPKAEHRRDDARAKALSAEMFSTPQSGKRQLKLWVKGTNWQVRVWRALLEIPIGEVTTYKRLAVQVCTQKAARAVGNAVGANPLAPIIPCHRVIRETGALGGYRWGLDRKKLLLATEVAPGGTKEAV